MCLGALHRCYDDGFIVFHLHARKSKRQPILLDRRHDDRESVPHLLAGLTQSASFGCNFVRRRAGPPSHGGISMTRSCDRQVWSVDVKGAEETRNCAINFTLWVIGDRHLIDVLADTDVDDAAVK